MKVKLIFNAQFCGHAEKVIEVPDDSTDEFIESLFPEEMGLNYDDNCNYVKL